MELDESYETEGRMSNNLRWGNVEAGRINRGKDGINVKELQDGGWMMEDGGRKKEQREEEDGGRRKE